MSKLGILLACEHYPAVSNDAKQIDAQLRKWLQTYGITFDEVEVFRPFLGELPEHAASCDTWVVSGAHLPFDGSSGSNVYAMKQFLRAAVSLGRPVFALHHGEHLLHAALAAFDAEPPATHEHIRSIRNPFRSLQGRDILHRFNPTKRTVDALERPAPICPRRLFGFTLKTAA